MAGSGGAGAAPREHRLQPGDTLPGLALRYGVTMEQIQRANRLYSSDTIFLKASLLIPAAPCPAGDAGDVPGDIPGDTGDIGDVPGDVPGDIPGDTGDIGDVPGDIPGDIGDIPGDVPGRGRRDLTASDFLRRLDAEIGRSKEAAQLLERQNSSPGGGPVPVSPRGARLGPRPLTRTPRVAALRDSEDEIFTL